MPSPTNLFIILAYVPVLVVSLYAFRTRRSGPELAVFFWFTLLSGVVNSGLQICWFYQLNNLPLFHLYVPLAFALLCWFYQIVWQGLAPKWLMPVLMGGFVLFSFINSLFFQGIFTFNSNALTVQSILLVMLSLSTFSLLLNEEIIVHNRTTIVSLNWINSGLFIYHASNLVMFYFGEIIMIRAFPPEMGRYAWLPHSFFSTVMYVCFFIGLWKSPKRLA